MKKKGFLFDILQLNKICNSTLQHVSVCLDFYASFLELARTTHLTPYPATGGYGLGLRSHRHGGLLTKGGGHGACSATASPGVLAEASSPLGSPWSGWSFPGRKGPPASRAASSGRPWGTWGSARPPGGRLSSGTGSPASCQRASWPSSSWRARAWSTPPGCGCPGAGCGRVPGGRSTAPTEPPRTRRHRSLCTDALFRNIEALLNDLSVTQFSLLGCSRIPNRTKSETVWTGLLIVRYFIQKSSAKYLIRWVRLTIVNQIEPAPAL